MSDRNGDLEVLKSMQHHGSIMTRPHMVDCFCYFPNKVSAERAAVKLQAEGFVVAVSPSPLPAWKLLFSAQKWLVLAQREVIPNEDNIFRLSDRMNALAKQYGGKYDGWGAPLVET